MEEHKNSHNSPYKFNGKELDEETGNYYYGARYYNPRTSIWLSVDAAWSRHPDKSPYAYVLNNPMRYKDPNGLWETDANGNLVAQKGDNAMTLAVYMGVSGKQALKVLANNNITVNSKNILNLKVGDVVDTGYYNLAEVVIAVRKKRPILRNGNYRGSTSTNEFGLTQVTKLGNSNIINNGGASEDTYKYQKKDGGYSKLAKHGDDWMKPNLATNFSNAVDDLVSEYPNQTIVFNDGSGYNPVNNKPYYNLGHSRTGGHSYGSAFDIRFLTSNGSGSNDINSLTPQDIKINGRFVEILKNHGFTTFYSDKGKIPGTKHADGHHNHLHGGMK